MTGKRRTAVAMAAAAASIALASGCGSGDGDGSSAAGTGGSASPSGALPQGREHVSIDPSQFTTQIDNRYFPMTPGSHWVYREVENGEHNRVDVTVTNKTRVVDGVTTRVVHDLVSRHGQPVENTYDWYAQDATGNLWYFGENTAEYENGKVVSRKGSFEAGVGGAEPGVVMPADPQVGQSYREELKVGEAEDRARITGVGETVTVPLDSYSDVVTTANTTPLEPNVLEHKWYAPNVGPVREALLSGGHGNTVLVRFTQG